VSYRDPPDLTHSRWMSVTDCGVYLARGVIDPRPLYDLARSQGWAVPEPEKTSLPGRATSGSSAGANNEKTQSVARRIVERLGLATPVNKASGACDSALATVVATLREAETVSDAVTSTGVSERAQYILWCRHCDWVGLSDQASHCEACQEWLCPECGGAEWVHAVSEPDERIRQWRESGVASLEEAAERLSALLEEVGKVPCVRCGRLFVADDPRLTNHWCRLGRLRNR
jgi:hypothetical protein